MSAIYTLQSYTYVNIVNNVNTLLASFLRIIAIVVTWLPFVYKVL
jgi:hypothetical protein